MEAPRPRRSSPPTRTAAKAVTAVHPDARPGPVTTAPAPPFVAAEAMRGDRTRADAPGVLTSEVHAPAFVAPPPLDRPSSEPREARHRLRSGQEVAPPTSSASAPAPQDIESTARRQEHRAQARPAPPPAERPRVGVLVPPPIPPSAPAPDSLPATQQPPTAAAATAPDVHVTIGRLEIRTGPAPTQASERSREPRASGLRSLEEYGAARAAAAGGTR